MHLPNTDPSFCRASSNMLLSVAVFEEELLILIACNHSKTSDSLHYHIFSVYPSYSVKQISFCRSSPDH